MGSTKDHIPVPPTATSLKPSDQDRRNLKCFFGMHQYEIIDKRNIQHAKIQSYAGVIYISKCVFCGKIKRDETWWD